jgi:N-acetylglucosaminyl-diphospho-decaprenol L-rhamnosyltransferase
MAQVTPLSSASGESGPVRERFAADHRFDEPVVSVVIVNYCQWEETAALVRQLRRSLCARQGAVEVVIVDNHSPGHPLVRRLRRLPGVSLRRWRRNRGFARAVNEGCRLGQAPWVLLLNPDVTVSEGFLDEVLLLSERLTARDPKVGVIGLHLRNGDGSCQPSAGPLPTLMGTVLGLLLPRSRRKYLRRRLRERGEVPWVTGCGLLVRRDCLKDVGGFDDGFFLYYEDVDFCRRARARGWSVLYEPALRLTHLRPLQLRAVTPTLRLVTRHALLTYASKHWPRWQAGLLHAIVAAEARVRRWLARWRGDDTAAEVFAELGTLAKEMRRGETVEARRRLSRAMRREEQQRASKLIRRHSQPQSARPAPQLSDQRQPIRSR